MLTDGSYMEDYKPKKSGYKQLNKYGQKAAPKSAYKKKADRYGYDHYNSKKGDGYETWMDYASQPKYKMHDERQYDYGYDEYEEYEPEYGYDEYDYEHDYEPYSDEAYNKHESYEYDDDYFVDFARGYGGRQVDYNGRDSVGEGHTYKHRFGHGSGNHSPWHGEIHRNQWAGIANYWKRPEKQGRFHQPNNFYNNEWF